MTLKITWVESVFNARNEGVAGAAKWSEQHDGMHFGYVCPCGCEDFRSIPVNTGEKQEGRWLWDGNREEPTITPSIQHVAHEPDDCKWHGFVTKGEFVTV